MANVGAIERETQNRIIDLFRDSLEYKFLGNLSKQNNFNIIEEKLVKYLSKKYSDVLIKKAIAILQRAAAKTNSLYDTNKEIYSLLRYGISVQESVSDKKQMVKFIEWDKDKVTENEFYIAEEVNVKGHKTRRPDLVIYVNGIALAVIELKRSTVSVSEGIRQIDSCQNKDHIPEFFNTVQLVCAGNNTEGLHYGVIETKEKYWLRWKEANPSVDNELDRSVLQLFEKSRFLEIIHGFIVFDRGNKKACRPNQYFGVKAAQERISDKEGGIIWHTQGSGKSLTMVWLAKWIRENIDDSRVLIITDRDELDKQIEKVFEGVSEEIKRAKSGSKLISMLNESNPWLICSLIHKFGKRRDNEDEGVTAEEIEKYIEELRKSLPQDFKAKGNIYVFVDECHRTQSGILHKAMKEIVGDEAIFIGFTGTPLLKDDKEKSVEIFGSYIHEYRFDEAVKDNVVLDLKYEARDIDQYINRPDKIDLWFETKTRALTPIALAALKQKWATMEKVFSSKERLERIVQDITLDMAVKPRLQNGRGNAMLVSDSIYNACRFYDMFQLTELRGRCAIVTSYIPNDKDTKGEATQDGTTQKLKQHQIYVQMLKDFGYKDTETEKFEDAMKEKFVKEPAQMKLLIVVDKLLTGFDAPSATYLYIDKTMHDHGLFQAICRVNRLDGDDKEYGYIIDYKDLFKCLESAFKDYTCEAFSGYSKDEIAGLLTDRLQTGKEDLDNALEAIHALCDRVQPQTTEEFIKFFYADTNLSEEEIRSISLDNSEKRSSLYKLASSLVRRYLAIANDMLEAGYSEERTLQIKNDVEFYNKLKDEIKIASGDFVDMKLYEPTMRQLLDTYIKADDSEKLSDLDDMSLVELLVERGEKAIEVLPDSIKEKESTVQETLEANMRKLIIDERVTNPVFYDKMSALLQSLIDKRRKGKLDYKKYLEDFIELSKKVVGGDINYPFAIDTKGKRALYDNLNNDEGLALKVDKAIQDNAHDGWRDTSIKTKKVKIAIAKALNKHKDDEQVVTIFNIVKNQYEY